MLEIFDTMQGAKRTFEPLEEGKVKMYVCGVTPYADAHLGHARCYVAYDVIYRHLLRSGYEVTYVRNFTDIDDKIIARANEEGIDPLALAERYIQSYYKDMDALGIARPSHEPRVSETIPEIISLVERLIDRGLAYPVESGDVFYSVAAFEGYGHLSGRQLDDLEAGARVEVNQEKRSPMDFALWKSAKPGEPSWTSPWGEGRPGWHIECSAMSLKMLGERFDIHGGGQDLVFPHHENEIAQSDGACGHQCVNFWVHNGFVNINQEKMSKSLGNFFSVNDVLERFTPQTLRFFLMSGGHYRKPINFSDQWLEGSAAKLAYFYDTLLKAQTILAQHPLDDEPALAEARAALSPRQAAFNRALNDDFHVLNAFVPVYESFKSLNEILSLRKQKSRLAARPQLQALLELIGDFDEVLQLFGVPAEDYLRAHSARAAKRRGLSLEWIEERVVAREKAREEKDWTRADLIRDELAEARVQLMDCTDKSLWRILEDATLPEN
ncbi:MAG: cysteine--tRNA ligase [Myxococcota bacterium]|nr:cysteine--tRNA ligase [Myxococcota bacterium]